LKKFGALLCQQVVCLETIPTPLFLRRVSFLFMKDNAAERKKNENAHNGAFLERGERKVK